MVLKMFLELALLGIFLNGAEGQLSISPSGTVEVEENSRLTLIASYTGPDSFTLVEWWKNSNTEYSLVASNCAQFGSVPDPATFEYNCTNGGKDFALTFKQVSASQEGEKWSCRVKTTPTPTDSSEVTIKIKADGNPDPGPDNGAIIGGSVAAVVVIIIIVVVVIFVYKKGIPCASAKTVTKKTENGSAS